MCTIVRCGDLVDVLTFAITVQCGTDSIQMNKFNVPTSVTVCCTSVWNGDVKIRLSVTAMDDEVVS